MKEFSIKAGVLEVACLEYGAGDGWPCIMLHGFPYDVHAYDGAAPILAKAGRAGDRALFAGLWADAVSFR